MFIAQLSVASSKAVTLNMKNENQIGNGKEDDFWLDIDRVDHNDSSLRILSPRWGLPKLVDNSWGHFVFQNFYAMEFHSWGTVPLNNDWLNINVSDLATKSKQSPSNFAEMLSNPVAFDLHSLKKRNRTCVKEIS